MDRVGVVGAGAVGGSLVAMMMDAGRAVTVLADGPRAERLRRDGLVVNGTRYAVDVDDAHAAGGESAAAYDLVLVATKSTQLQSALPLIVRAAGSEGLVLSLLNGISSERVIADAGVPGRVVPAMILGIDAMKDGKAITYLNRGTIYFGSDERHGAVAASNLARVETTFAASGIPCKLVPDIVRTLWWKFMINVGINQGSAVLRAPYGLFQRSDYARDLMVDAMREVLTLSELEQTGLGESDIDAWLDTLRGLNPEGKTSMVQDVEAGRPTEVDLFAGTVLEIASRHGIDVPVNRTLYRIIRAGEGR